MLLDKHDNVSDVAKILGVDRRTSQRKKKSMEVKVIVLRLGVVLCPNGNLMKPRFPEFV
jgi:hypothetical protein